MFSGDRWQRETIRRQWHWWYVRIGIALFLLSHLTPAGPRATLGPAQTVETEKPLVCVHTRLIDEVWEWKIQRSLELVREMGADTIVEFFPWPYIEHQPGQYDWEPADRIMRHAANQGIKVIARMGFVPAWAQPKDQQDFNTLNDLPEDSFPDFAGFVAQFAARYAGQVDQIIIWNEPNLSFEWGYRPVDPAAYTRLLQAVYAPVHAANPDVQILAGALAPTLEPLGSANGLNDLLYLEAMYEAGAAPYFDALAVHTYGFVHPPEAEPAADRLNFRRAELLHDIMGRYDDPEKPVYITETGWNDSPRWNNAVSPAQRIQYTLNAYHWAEDHWDWAEKMCLWVFRFPAPTQSYPDHFTFTTTSFQQLPIYHAVQDYARGWESETELWLPAPSE